MKKKATKKTAQVQEPARTIFSVETEKKGEGYLMKTNVKGDVIQTAESIARLIRKDKTANLIIRTSIIIEDDMERTKENV